jgi:hypothetical protein
MSEMKLITENWRGYLNETAQEPTVAEFLQTFAKQDPKSFMNILKVGARQVASIAGGALVATAAGTAVGAATGGAGGIGGAALGYAAGSKLAEEGLNRIFGRVAEKSTELARFMAEMAKRQVDDGERAGIDNYYDIDDEFETLIGGMDSDLGEVFTEVLFNIYRKAFANIDKVADGNKPLSDYLAATANDQFTRFIRKKDVSGVGLSVQKPSKSSLVPK